MSIIPVESPMIYQPPSWWQRALVADGQSWILVGTLTIGLILVSVLAMRYLYHLWWIYRIRAMRKQGVVPSSELRVGQCALLQPSSASGAPHWRTLIRGVYANTIEVDLPLAAGLPINLEQGSPVTLVVNSIDCMYLMESEVIRRERDTLFLRRQPLMRRLQRRQFTRIDLLAPATFEVVGGKSLGSYTATLLDIGGGGVCLQAPVALEIGTILLVQVPLLEGVLPTPTRVNVVGVSQTVVDGRLEYRLHCAFAGMNAEQSERVARYIVEHQRQVKAQRRWLTPLPSPEKQTLSCR